MELTVAVRKEKVLNKNTVYWLFYLPSFIAINYFQGPKYVSQNLHELVSSLHEFQIAEIATKEPLMEAG